MPNVEYTHVGEDCSFDTFLKKHKLTDKALQDLAITVRAADTDRLDLAPKPLVCSPSHWARRAISAMTTRCCHTAW